MKMIVCALITGLATTLQPVSTLADETDTLVQTEMQKHQIAGVALTVIKDGQPLKTQCYGVANLEWNTPVTTDTVFEIGSITKQFTAACILMLAQEGKVSLDEKISAYLTNTPPAWSNITVRHLLTHTSGVRNYDLLKGFELRNHLTQEQFIAKLAAEPLDFQPGNSWKYSNSGFSLLGYIVENASGKSYWAFLNERILQPLQMNRTYDRNPGVIVTNRAAGYEISKKTHLHINRDYDLTDLFAAGAIMSTLSDVAKWDAALDGDKLLTQASKEQWWTPMKLNNGTVSIYGFGWFIGSLEGHRNIGHGGATSGFSAAIQRFPDDKLDVIALCNADELDVANNLAKKVALIYLPKTAGK